MKHLSAAVKCYLKLFFSPWITAMIWVFFFPGQNSFRGIASNYSNSDNFVTKNSLDKTKKSVIQTALKQKSKKKNKKKI